jgi:hypothetical protein
MHGFSCPRLEFHVRVCCETSAEGGQIGATRSYYKQWPLLHPHIARLDQLRRGIFRGASAPTAVHSCGCNATKSGLAHSKSTSEHALLLTFGITTRTSCELAANIRSLSAARRGSHVPAIETGSNREGPGLGTRLAMESDMLFTDLLRAILFFLRRSQDHEDTT